MTPPRAVNDAVLLVLRQAGIQTKGARVLLDDARGVFVFSVPGRRVSLEIGEVSLVAWWSDDSPRDLERQLRDQGYWWAGLPVMVNYLSNGAS